MKASAVARSTTIESVRRDDAEEQQPADPPVGAEPGEAVLGAVEIDARRLPNHLCRREREARLEGPRKASNPTGAQPERRADTELQRHEEERLHWGHLPAGQRTRARAHDLCVEIAVEQVVERAAGA